MFLVRSIESADCWDAVSPYRNDYDEVLRDVSYMGGISDVFNPSSIKPDLSTDGAFPKCWRLHSPGCIVLYKCGGESFGSKGCEPYCEVLASQIFARMDVGISYKLTDYKGSAASVCGLFSNENESFVQYSRVIPESPRLSDILHYYESIGAFGMIRRMLICDAITLNSDRHTGNHGVLCDSMTNVVLSAAPPFDYNLSLLANNDVDCVDDLLCEIPYVSSKICDMCFDSIVKACMTFEIYEDFKKFKGITLTLPYCTERFTEDRLRWTNDVVNYQIDRYIKMFG